jgi:hypothetical protein
MKPRAVKHTLRCALALALVVVASASGCATVRPWEHGLLARGAIEAPPWPLVERGMQHTLQIREASQGAYGSAGGGCGCN